MGIMPWRALSSWTQNSPETSGGGVARDCKIHPGRREELTVRHRKDCWEGHVRRVLGLDSYPPPPSSSAFSSPFPAPCAREIYVTFPRVPLILDYSTFWSDREPAPAATTPGFLKRDRKGFNQVRLQNPTEILSPPAALWFRKLFKPND